MNEEMGIVPLDNRSALGLCLVMYGQVVYQCDCPALSDIEGWNLAVNGIRQRIASEGL